MIELNTNIPKGTKDWDKLINQNFKTIQDTTNNFSNPNLLINGDFQVWQRGEKFIPVEKKIYTSDRWITENNTGEVCREPLDEKDIPSSDCLVVKTLTDSSSIYTGIAQILDKNEFGKTYNGKTMTVSFWYKTNKKATFQFWNGESITPVGNLDVIDKWTYETVTFIFNNSTVNNFALAFRPNTAKDSELRLTCVKLELGSAATPFAPRQYGEELALCQRYYRVAGVLEFRGQFYTENMCRLSYSYPTMRSAPTLTFPSQDKVSIEAIGSGVKTGGTCFLKSSTKTDAHIDVTGLSKVEAYRQAMSLFEVPLDAEIY